MSTDPRAFGPALQGAKAANTVANAFGAGVPLGNTALGLAGLFANPSPAAAAQFIGQAITNPSLYATLFPSLFKEAAAGAAGAGAGAGAGAAGGLAASAAAAVPGLIFSAMTASKPITELTRPDAARSARRTRDAGTLTGETLRAIQAGDLAAPIGENRESLGNTLASLLNFNQDATWMRDTAHDWLPDPSLTGLQGALHAGGFPGTRVEGGQIVKREPMRRDVGGVGEMVASGALRPYGAYPEAWFDPGSSEGGSYRHPGPYANAGSATLGSMGWEAMLRGASGAPPAPSTFDPSLRHGLAQLTAPTPDLRAPHVREQPYEEDPVRRSHQRENTDEWQAMQANESALANSYLSAIPSADAVMDEYRRRRTDKEAAQNLGSPA